MSSKYARFGLIPVIFAAALVVGACSADPMMKDDGMGHEMESEMMMDDAQGMEKMDSMESDGDMDESMDDSMDSMM